MVARVFEDSCKFYTNSLIYKPGEGESPEKTEINCSTTFSDTGADEVAVADKICDLTSDHRFLCPNIV